MIIMKLVTVEQMRSIEAASDAQGHTYAAMMDRAGSAVARVIQTRLAVRGKKPPFNIASNPGIPVATLVVFCMVILLSAEPCDR